MPSKPRFNGTSGNDTIAGSALADILTGYGGNDIYIVNHAGDEVVESSNQGNDTVLSYVSYALSANVENITLVGAGSLNATGNSQNNVLTGNDSANVINGGAGADTMIGLGGNDTYYVDNAGDVVVEEANAGTDTVLSSVTYTLANHVENLTLTGNSSINATGNALDNALVGNSHANTLDGLAGADSMAGGGGNDTYIVDDLGDAVTENANQGTDTVRSSVRYTLGANVENLVLVGAAAIDGTGNSLNNTITGNTAANILDGGAGEDAMAGGAGDDLYIVDNSDDAVTEGLNAGIDTVQSSVSHALGNNVENLTLTGTHFLSVGVGNALDNVIVGTDGTIDILAGRAGNDTITGAGGLDYIDGGSGVDTAVYSGALSDYELTPLQEVFPFLESGWNWESGSPGSPHTGPYRFGAFVSDQRAGAPDSTDFVRNVEVLQFADRSVFIDGTNNAPVAVGETYSASEDTELVIAVSTLLANDSDFDGNTLTIASVGNAVNGSVVLDGANVRFTPAADYFGPASFTYQVSDGAGGFDEASVDIDVAPVNDAPTVAGAVSGSGAEGSGTFSVDLLSGASDVDPGAVLHVENLVWTDTGTGMPDEFTLVGDSIEVNTDAAAYNGIAEGETFDAHFSYDVVDENGASVAQTATISITGTNDDPVANADVNDTDALVEQDDAAASGNVLANDTDPDLTDSLSVTGVAAGTAGGPVSGDVGTAVAGTYGTLTLGADGQWDYALDDADTDTDALAQDEPATDVFTYSVSDGHGGSATSTLTLSITGTNDAAILSADVRNLTETDDAADISATGTLTISDVDSAETFQPATSTGAYGTFAIDDTGAWTYTADSAHDEFVEGVTYTDSFTVASADGTQTSVTINILGTADAGIVLVGTEGDDPDLIGTDNDDDISGLGGNDGLYGLAGDDVLDGGAGNDDLNGGAGNDQLDGGAGDDSVFDFEGGSDVLTGGEGNDSLNASDWHVTDGGSDTLDGGAGDDFLYRQAGGVDVFGTSLSGGEGNDTLLLYLQDDGAAAATAVMDGGAGDDTLIVSLAYGAGAQQLQISGGDGADEIQIQATNLPTVVDAGAGADTVRLALSSATSVTLGTGADQIVFDSWDGAAVVTVADFAAAEDKLDVTALLNALPAWDGSNPFGAAGILRFAQDGADALFEVDSDGGGDSYVTLARLQNFNLAATPITAANLIPSFPVDGSELPGQTIEGDENNNVLVGTIAGDILRGFGGNDQLFGGAGVDLLEGGDDQDVLYGEAGSDALYGGEGNDDLNGGTGSDQLDGEAGDDAVADYDGGSDVLLGGEGNDSLSAWDWHVTGGGSDTLDGGAGDDFLYRQAGGVDVFATSLSGGEGNDTLSLYLEDGGVVAATAVMDGGAGDDFMIVRASGAGGQQLQISGGDGADEIHIQSTNLPMVVDAGAGDDTVLGVGSAANHAVNAGQGADTVRLTLSNAASVTLGAGADRIVIDSWNGASAVTVADFAAAEDTLDYTSVLSTLQGWDGSNPFSAGFLRFAQDGADALFEVDGDGGNDSYVTLARLQNFNLAATPITAANLIPSYPVDGSAPVGETIEGDETDNTLTGTIADDILRGFGGNDQLSGGPGGDLLEGGDDQDILYGEAGDDVLEGGLGHDQLIGDAGNDALYGGEGNDDLNGGAGTDQLDGGAGDDSVADVDGGSDALMGGEGNDSLSAWDWYVTGGGSDTLDGGAGDDDLYRQAGGVDIFATSLSGGEGNDTLSLYLQDDGATAATAVMDGGTGNDILIVRWAYGVGGQLQISGGDDADEIYIYSANVSTVVDAGAGDDMVFGVGTAASHQVNAGQGADTVGLLLNNAADVTLGAGADQIVVDSWNGASAVTVADFDVAEDTLDLRSVLSGYNGDLHGFVQLSASGSDTLLSVDQDGGADNFAALANLENVTYTPTLLDDLVASGNLIVQ